MKGGGEGRAEEITWLSPMSSTKSTTKLGSGFPDTIMDNRVWQGGNIEQSILCLVPFFLNNIAMDAPVRTP